MSLIASAPVSHGGSLDAARSRFPGAPEPIIDLSTGINPEPYPFTRLPAEAYTRLPEPAGLRRLQAAAAARYGVADPDSVVPAPGTQVLINLLPHLFPQDEVRVLGPTYAEHARAWAQTCAQVDSTATAAAGRHALVLCNPNNPDGRRIPRAELLALAGRVPLLLVDEAFADFEGDELSLAPYLTEPGLVVLRSFGKAYGLAGIRLGFALAAPATARRIRDALGPWAVSGPAQTIGLEALADTAWTAATAVRLREDAARLDALLRRAGCEVVGGTALFRLARTRSAASLFDRLGRAGIFVRAFPEHPDQLRFGLPRRDHWSRLEAAFG
ncbi:MAG: threonine-phosphate decarboxylase CobD [Acetobacteraceae bacterium]